MLGKKVRAAAVVCLSRQQALPSTGPLSFWPRQPLVRACWRPLGLWARLAQPAHLHHHGAPGVVGAGGWCLLPRCPAVHTGLLCGEFLLVVLHLLHYWMPSLVSAPNWGCLSNAPHLGGCCGNTVQLEVSFCLLEYILFHLVVVLQPLLEQRGWHPVWNGIRKSWNCTNSFHPYD